MLKVTIIEGPHAKKVKENASLYLSKIIKREINRLGESEMRKVVSK